MNAFRQTIVSHNAILTFRGDLTYEMSQSILRQTERTLTISGEKSEIRRKVYRVLVEALQNIVKHTADVIPGEPLHPAAFFLIHRDQHQYSITSGNPVHKKDISSLRETLERIRCLNKEGLKDLYHETIKNSTLSRKGDAGLGMLDMARKSGKKMEWSFVDIREGLSFFSLRVNIPRIA